MECDEHIENGKIRFERTPRAVRLHEYQREFEGGARSLRLDVANSLPRTSPREQMHIHLVPSHPPPKDNHAFSKLPVDIPFMNNMDEISYWVYTKRAPCLLNYDNLFKRQTEGAQCSKSKSIHSIAEEVPSPKKKKKRKLTILDDDSRSTEKQQNVYFNSSRQNQRIVLSSCKSGALSSDIDFNIKSSSAQDKPKRIKLEKNSKKSVQKKNKMVTSTPKVTNNLRRSLRKSQKSINNNSHLNSSFEIFTVNGKFNNTNAKTMQKSPEKSKKSEKLAGGDSGNRKIVGNEKSKNDTVLNGQFDDLSDVSGFTANYIRSTKVNSTKTPRKLRRKPSRNLAKESQQRRQRDEAMVVCVNKSVNTGLPKSAMLNCSTDSSQNVVNLVTTVSNDKSKRVSRGTSVLKFLDPKVSKSKESSPKPKLDASRRSRTNLNISFGTQSSGTPRYPKRTKYSLLDSKTNTSADKKRKLSKNSSEFNNSDRKENPDEKSVSRTRSGRSVGLTLRQPENSVLVLNNSSERVSSAVSVNVANLSVGQKKRVSRCSPRGRKPVNKTTQSLRKDSLRDRSGFTAYFSDSDDDKPLRQQKFFC